MVCKIVFLLIVFSFVHCQNEDFFDNLQENDVFNENWKNDEVLSHYSYLQNFLQNFMEIKPFVNSSIIVGNFTNVIDTIIDQLNLTNITVAGEKDKCVIDSLRLILNIYKEWALQMIDATGKISSGILLGASRWMGRYYECKSISVPSIPNSSFFEDFKGEYCSVTWSAQISPEFETTIITGICVPDSCHSIDLINDTRIIRSFINEIPVVRRINHLVNISDITCSNDENRTLDAGAIFYIIILGIFALFLVAGTICDIIVRATYKEIPATDKNTHIERNENTDMEQNENISVNFSSATRCFADRDDDDEPLWSQEQKSKSRKEPGQIEKFLICFSVYTNAAKLLNVESSAGQLECLHGVRFLSMSWVILGHVYVFSLSSTDNMLNMLEDYTKFSFQMISRATFSVDSFFVLSGLLITYLFLNECKKREGQISWLYYYIHRIWRLTPTFAMILGFYATLFIYLGSGPLWPNEVEGGRCEKGWWWNLLYIQNFQKEADMCMAWTWFLANDMQFYVISPLILIFLWKLPIVGLIITGIFLLTSWITTCILTVVNHLPIFAAINTNQSDSLIDILKKAKDQADIFDILYDKPYIRIGAYLIGVLLGYILYRTQRQKILEWWMLIVGWIVALSMFTSLIFGLYHVYITETMAAAYNTFSRTTWSIALGWVIYVCLTGQGGIVNSILSLKLWIPFSRLTYCAYLVHPMVMIWYFSSLEVLFHYQNITIVMHYFGFLLFSYIIAFVASVAFESPMMAIEKFFLQRKSDS